MNAQPQQLHRYNKQLPSSYRSQINSEWILMKKAMFVLIDSINQCSSGKTIVSSNTDQEWGADKHVLMSESYSTQLERHFAALEKGIDRYVDLKFPFQSDDYQPIINCLMKGILSHNIDMGLRCKLARCVTTLMNKKHCHLPDGLDWRPIHDILVKVHIDCIDGGTFLGREIRDTHARSMVSLLSKTRIFLTPDDSAQKIWSEFYQLLSESDVNDQFKHLLFLSHVLPTRGDAWSGWIPQAFELWKSLDASNDWDTIWIDLFGRLARHQPLICDWTPYLPWIYSRIVPIFRLPLGKNAPVRITGRSYPVQYIFLLESRNTAMAAVFAIYSLSPQYPASFDHLERLLAVLGNYFHPSNGGRWSSALGTFLAQMVGNLSARIIEERKATAANHSDRIIGNMIDFPVAPREHRLTPECINRLLDLLLPLVKHGLYSKNTGVSLQAASAARDLSIIDPDRVFIPLLEEASESLVSLSSPHRTTAALRLLTALSSVFFDPQLSPNGENHLLNALELTLPGIDPNDIGKTDATLRFIGGATASLRSRTNSQMSDSTSSFLEEYIHQLLSRVFSFLESIEAPSKKDRFGSSHHSSSLSYFSFLMGIESLFSILPKNAVLSAARRIVRQVVQTSCSNGMKYYGLLVRTVAAVSATVMNNSATTLFVPPLIESILDNDDGESSGSYSLMSIGETELVWRIRILAQVCRTCGSGLPQYIDQLTTIVDLAFQKSSRPMYKAGGRLLRGILEGLTSTRTIFEVEGEDFKGEMHPDLESECFEWYIPSEEDLQCGKAVIKKFVENAEKMCEGHIATSESVDSAPDRDVLFRVLRMLHAVQRGGRWLFAGCMPQKIKSLHSLVESSQSPSEEQAVLIMKMPVAAGLGGGRNDSESQVFAKEFWGRIYSLNLSIIQTVLNKRPDDGALLYRCLEPIELAHEPFRYGHRSRQAHQLLRFFKTWFRGPVSIRRPLETTYGVGRYMPRFITKLRIEAHHEVRLSMTARAGMATPEIFDSVIEALTNLSLNEFPRVRGEARIVLSRGLRIAKPWIKRREIKKAILHIERVSSLLSSSTKKLDQDQDQDPHSSETEMKSVDHSFSGQKQETNGTMVESIGKNTSKETLLDQMIGASAILRSAPVAPLLVRDWNLLFSVMKALFSAVPAAERPDAGKAIQSLFVKLVSLVRPLRLRPGDIDTSEIASSANSLLMDEKANVKSNKKSGYIDLCELLLGTIDSSYNVQKMKQDDNPNAAIDKEEGGSDAHWRLQCLVAFILYVILRADRAPPPAVARFFAEGLTSDLLELRFVSSKAVRFILLMHGTNVDADKVSSSPANEVHKREALKEIEKVVMAPGFFETLIKTTALDQDDSHGEGSSEMAHARNMILGSSGGLTGLLGLSKTLDGDMYWNAIGGAPWPSSWIPRQRDSMNLFRIRLYESLISVFGFPLANQFVTGIRMVIDRLERKESAVSSGVRNEDARVVIAEALAGVCRGLSLSVTDFPDGRGTIDEISIALLKQFSGPIGTTSASTLIRLITTSEQGMVGRTTGTEILNWLLEPKPFILPLEDGTTTTELSRTLRYLHACVADHGELEDEKLARFTKAILPSLLEEQGFDHGSKSVRDEVARCLSTVLVYLPKEIESILSQGIEVLVQRITNEDENTCAESTGVESGESSSESRDANDEGLSLRKKSILRQAETLSTCISLVIVTGRGRHLEQYVAQFIPILFRSFDDSDQERLVQYKTALALFAQCAYSEKTIDEIVKVLSEVVTDSRWKVRMSILQFIQVFSFTSLFLANRSFLQDVLSIVYKLLLDAQLEVRQAAASVLVTMVRDAPSGAIESIREQCISTIQSTTSKKKKSKRTPMDANTLRKRHGAVLGLSSMVAANPYTIPEWVPDVLDCLASCVNDPPPISTGVREVYANFSRTHRDEWATHKLSFTEDQLDTISELLASPTYFA